VKWGQEEPAEVEQQAVPVLSIDQAQKQFSALSSTAPFMLFINAETGRVQVVQRLTSGQLAVIEPYPEGTRVRTLPSRMS
jgi:hypothetical protein